MKKNNFLSVLICLQFLFGPFSVASSDLSLDANEFAANVRNEIAVFEKNCLNKDGKIATKKSFMYGSSIKSCSAQAELINKKLIPGMDEIIEQAGLTKENQNCSDCSNSKVSYHQTETDLGSAPACSLEKQKILAKQQCSTGCEVLAATGLGFLGTSFGNCKSAGLKTAASCIFGLGKGIATGIIDVLTWLPKLIWDGGKWAWNKAFGEKENKTTEKAHALSQLSDKEIKEGQKNPEKLKQSLLERAGNFFQELSKAIIGYPEYEAKAKCSTCAEKTALMCGVIGNAGGFLITIFGNGFVFGAAKGTATKVATKLLSLSKGSSRLSKWSAVGISAATKAKVVTKPFVWVGEIAVKGFSGVSSYTVKSWSKFKNSSLAQNLMKFKNTKIYNKTLSKNSIPGKITLSVGRGVEKAFKKMNEFETKMFEKGVKTTNKELYKKMISSKTPSLDAEKIHSLYQNGKIDEANALAIHDIDELKVIKDTHSVQPQEYWENSKKITLENAPDLKPPLLDDIENAIESDFDGLFKNPELIETSYIYQDGKKALLKNKDGSHSFYDLEKGEQIGKTISKEKSKYVDSFLDEKNLEKINLNQTKINLEINGIKYQEKIDAAGKTVLEIKPPKGCVVNGSINQSVTLGL